MLLLLADENVKRQLVRGLLRRSSNMNIITVQDAGLSGQDDPSLLEWAASAGRVLITYDLATMPDTAYKRVAQGLPMTGVFAISWDAPIGRVIDDLLLLSEASLPGE